MSLDGFWIGSFAGFALGIIMTGVSLWVGRRFEEACIVVECFAYNEEESFACISQHGSTLLARGSNGVWRDVDTGQFIRGEFREVLQTVWAMKRAEAENDMDTQPDSE